MVLCLVVTLGFHLKSSVALSAVMTIIVICHENTRSTHGVGTFTSQTNNLSLCVNLVKLQSCQWHIFVLVWNPLWLSVVLLLSLLSTTTKAKQSIKRGTILKALSKNNIIFQITSTRHKTKGRGDGPLGFTHSLAKSCY